MDARLLLVCLLVPLANGSIVKKEVTLLVEVGLGGGQRVWEQSLRAACMYKARHLWSGYLKKLERARVSVNTQWNRPRIS